MEISVLNIDKLIQMLSRVDGEIQEKDNFDKFLYNFFSINNEMTIDDIENLDTDYTERLIKLLEDYCFNYRIERKNTDFKRVEQLYKFNFISENFKNAKQYTNAPDIQKSLLFY